MQITLYNTELQQEETVFTFHVVYIHTFSTGRQDLIYQSNSTRRYDKLKIYLESMTKTLFLSEGWEIR